MSCEILYETVRLIKDVFNKTLKIRSGVMFILFFVPYVQTKSLTLVLLFRSLPTVRAMERPGRGAMVYFPAQLPVGKYCTFQALTPLPNGSLE